jgi:hypothetical protein
MVVVFPYHRWLCSVIFNRRDKNRQDLGLEYFFCHWHGSGCNRVHDSNSFHTDTEAILYLFRCKSGEPYNYHRWTVQIHPAPGIPWATHYFHWNFNFDIQLVIHPIDDDSCHAGESLPDQSGGKIYDRTIWRKLQEISATNKENHPNALLRCPGRDKSAFE